MTSTKAKTMTIWVASESTEPNPVPGMEWALLEYLLVE